LEDGAVSSKSVRSIKSEKVETTANISDSNDQNLSNLNSINQQQAQLPSNTPESNQVVEKVINQTPLTPASPLTAFLQSSDQKMQSILNTKKRVVHRYFDELSQTYVQAHNREYKDFNLKGTSNPSAIAVSGSNQHNNSALDQIRQTVSKITHYNEFKNIASVNYNSDMYATSSIVSSVDFDRSYEHFAMAGVTKRIKIFDFQNIIERPSSGVHYPLYEMTHTAKLSCVNWNRYFRQQLACSDYDGVVTLWDAEQGKCVQSFQEHEKRCWGVQFCEVDPRLLASGSDDSKVKIWSTNSDYSLMSIDAKSNVCCVIFKPESKYHVLFGTADHTIHYYDIRNPKEPVALFKGHKKAVSYVKFTGDNEFISASTDSTLKMWRLNEGQCVRTYTGHTNEKNFVGLDTRNGYVVTGSENNTVFLYANELSKPLMTYKFDDVGQTAAGAATGNGKKDEGVNDFVSAVCWSNVSFDLIFNFFFEKYQIA
jgi:E3 ubiquitin-protein ligase RFWD2